MRSYSSTYAMMIFIDQRKMLVTHLSFLAYNTVVFHGVNGLLQFGHVMGAYLNEYAVFNDRAFRRVSGTGFQCATEYKEAGASDLDLRNEKQSTQVS